MTDRYDEQARELLPDVYCDHDVPWPECFNCAGRRWVAQAMRRAATEARAEALEEAANRCDRLADRRGEFGDPWPQHNAMVFRASAEAIRALAKETK